MFRALNAWLGIAALTAALAHAAPARAGDGRASCESLARAALGDAAVSDATLVEAGRFEMPLQPHRGHTLGAKATGAEPPKGALFDRGPYALSWESANPRADVGSLPEFCRVTGVLTPTPRSHIRFEVWLPTKTWNGKLLGVGSGGLGGVLNYTGVPLGITDAVRMGYAGAVSDAGHDASQDGNDGSFLLGNPEALVDYGNRSIHEMTVKAKLLIQAFYGREQTEALFIGCSMGSMEAINEVARHPLDYDGVIAGALMNPVGRFNAAQLWPSWLVAHDPAKAMTREQIAMVHRAALRQCATPLGLHDGDIENPAACRFDPSTLLCKTGQSADCLTASQAQFMRQVYEGPVNPRTGQSIFPGPAPGAEDEIDGSGTAPQSASLALLRYGVMQDPDWDWRNLDYDKDIDKADAVLNPTMQVGSNVNPFLDRGGKLLIYIGWQDYHNPLQTISYYQSVLSEADPVHKDDVRLFLVPGMGHCVGGAGCDRFDAVGAVDHWLKTGQAPEQLVSRKIDSSNGKVLRTRPLCAYPRTARYGGTGDMDAMQSFACESSH